LEQEVKKPAKTSSPNIRCAIYTRKSCEEGLELEFNSLDAQRESAEAFIASQQLEGWQCLPERYDDGGFSGGSLERPALGRLLEDIKEGKIDCVVVYKVDRLSRSLLDFTRIMEVFDKQKVSFVSVTQQFNTTTSMGRLTALAKAYAWQEQLESGQFEDLEDIAKEQGVDRSYVGRMLQLTSLAPDIVESILAGQAFADISLQHCRKGIPVFWEEQRRTLIAA
jgi:hypothetical protein